MISFSELAPIKLAPTLPGYAALVTPEVVVIASEGRVARVQNNPGTPEPYASLVEAIAAEKPYADITAILSDQSLLRD